MYVCMCVSERRCHGSESLVWSSFCQHDLHGSSSPALVLSTFEDCSRYFREYPAARRIFITCMSLICRPWIPFRTRKPIGGPESQVAGFLTVQSTVRWSRCVLVLVVSQRLSGSGQRSASKRTAAVGRLEIDAHAIEAERWRARLSPGSPCNADSPKFTCS